MQLLTPSLFPAESGIDDGRLVTFWNRLLRKRGL